MPLRPQKNEACRNLEIRDLWLQNEVKQGLLEVSKIDGSRNPADLMTKILSIKDIVLRLEEIGLESRWSEAPNEMVDSNKVYENSVHRKVYDEARTGGSHGGKKLESRDGDCKSRRSYGGQGYIGQVEMRPSRVQSMFCLKKGRCITRIHPFQRQSRCSSFESVTGYQYQEGLLSQTVGCDLLQSRAHQGEYQHKYERLGLTGYERISRRGDLL